MFIDLEKCYVSRNILLEFLRFYLIPVHCLLSLPAYVRKTIVSRRCFRSGLKAKFSLYRKSTWRYKTCQITLCPVMLFYTNEGDIIQIL